MFLRQLDLTTALRPSLLQDETLLFVQDNVGLYEGKFKIPNCQNGQAYLTSHRICYVDNEDPRKFSVAVDLKDVDRPEFYAGFLKSSAKITLYAKTAKRTSVAGRSTSTSTPVKAHGSPLRSLTSSPAPTPPNSATWICPICSFSNDVPQNFDPSTANARTPLPPCRACGIQPPLINVIKAALAALRSPPTAAPSQTAETDSIANSIHGIVTGHAAARLRCPRCTFDNDPGMRTCEMCGAPLPVQPEVRRDLNGSEHNRDESPGPSLGQLSINEDVPDSIKLSFRTGGEKVFYERLKGALVQRKWLLESKPPPPPPRPKDASSPSSIVDTGSGHVLDRNKVVGIAGLERRNNEQRRNAEMVIGNAFEDLEALMTSAKEVIALAESLASQANLGSNESAEANAVISQSASALGLVTTKDMLGSGSASESLYISELSRNLAEFLTDDSKGILKREGGIMSLVDLWAVFNRERGGVELISPTDFSKAADLWDKLKLPLRLRKFKSGLLVVQGRDRTDDKTIANILAWLQEFHIVPPDFDVPWDWRLYGRGITAQEAAERFGWSVGVASEELEMAEEKGALCREQGLDGMKFWENRLLDLPPPGIS